MNKFKSNGLLFRVDYYVFVVDEDKRVAFGGIYGIWPWVLNHLI